MKKILLSIVTLCCTVVAGAQTTDQISAILQVGNEAPQVFYGIGALQKAMAAAPDRGGIITLSSGNFNSVTINKDVKIYGAGFETNEAEDITLTNINSGFSISIPEEITGPHDIILEGVYVNGNITVDKTLNGFSFIKSSVNTIKFTVATTSTTVRQSYIRGNLEGGHNLYVQNSYLNCKWIGPFSDESNVLVDHCILVNGYDFDNGGTRFSCQNSIVAAGWNNGIQTYNYCLCPHWSNLNGFIGSYNNWFSIGDANVFEDAENFNYSADRTFKLTEQNQTRYIGNDGTQVGVYGGSYPWNKEPSTPVVKNLKAKVAGTDLNVTYNAVVR